MSKTLTSVHFKILVKIGQTSSTNIQGKQKAPLGQSEIHVNQHLQIHSLTYNFIEWIQIRLPVHPLYDSQVGLSLREP